MATSLRDLLATLQAELRRRPDQAHADDAAAALAPAGRALHRLVDDGLHATHTSNQQGLLVRDLGSACHAAAQTWAGLGHGRLTDLAGVGADIVDLLRHDMGYHDRWAAAIALATTARRCATLAAQHRPYRDVPQLARVRRAAAGVERLGLTEPPAPHRETSLDRLLPVAGLPPGLPGGQIAAESAAALADQLHRLHGHGQQLSLIEALAVLHVAESITRYATQLAHTLDATPHSVYLWRDTAHAWGTSRHTLDPFDDGTRQRPGHASRLTLWAARVRQGLRLEAESLAAAGPASLPRSAELARAATAARVAVNQLPGLAQDLTGAVARWGVTGRLVARSGDLPLREDRVAAQLRAAIVTVAAQDLGPTIVAIRTAGMLSTALAVELDRTAGDIGERPQPHLAAAYAAALAAPRVTEDLARRAIDLRRSDRADPEEQVRQHRAAPRDTTKAMVPAEIAARMSDEPERGGPHTPGDAPTGSARRWAPFVRAVAGDAVLADPSWPSLAAGLDRAAASGWDVAANLPRLITQRDMPERHPAGELYCRVAAACDAASPRAAAGIAETNRRDPTPARDARRHAELARPTAPPAAQPAPVR